MKKRGRVGKPRRAQGGNGPARLIWHIGDHKTGSTAIQEALHAAPRSELAFVTEHFNHTWLAVRLQKGLKSGPVRRGFARIAKALAETEAPVAVVSAEEFEHVSPHVLRRAIAHYLPDYIDKLEVIAYARPHVEAVRSRYCERVKLGTYFTGPWRMAMGLRRQGVMPYLSRFSYWAETFPGAFTLRPMVRAALTDGDAVADFFRVTRLEHLAVEPRRTVNQAMTAEDLAMVQVAQSVLKRAGMPDAPRAHLGRALGRLLTADPMPGHHDVHLPPLLVRLLARAWRKDAAALDDAFFETNVMSQALEAALARSQRCQGRGLAVPRSLPPELVHDLTKRTKALIALDRAEWRSASEALAQDLAPRLREVSRDRV